MYLFTLPYMVWSSIVIVHEKGVFSSSFYRNISKRAETILTKKVGRNHGILVYKKALISEHRKIITFLSKCLLVRALPNFCGRTSSKTGVNLNFKTKVHIYIV